MAAVTDRERAGVRDAQSFMSLKSRERLVVD